MKSLERKFSDIMGKSQNLSSYICFVKTIKGQGFNKQTIQRWFNKLVHKDDYSKDEKRELLKHLENISNTSRTTEIRGKNAF